jgi:hypothetical protein
MVVVTTLATPPLLKFTLAGKPGQASRRGSRRAQRMLKAVAARIRFLRELFPLTFTGLLLLSLSAATFWFMGVRRQDLVLLACGFLGLTLVLLVALAVTCAAVGVHVTWRRAASRPSLVLECGAAQETGFRTPVPTWLPLIEYSWKWRKPADVTVLSADARDPRNEVIIPARRGTWDSIIREVSVRDALGFASITWAIPEKADVRFLPAPGALDVLTLVENLAAGDDLSDPRGAPEGDRVDMRQYALGDSPRMILWKAYAHTRRLLVRVPERAMAARPRSCAYFVASAADEPNAGLMRILLERGLLGEGWRFGADGCAGETGRLDEAIDMLVRSGSAAIEDYSGPGTFMKRAEKDGYSACIVLLPPSLGPWVSSIAAALSTTSMRVHAYAVVDRARLHERHPRWFTRVLCRAADGGRPQTNTVASLAAAFPNRSFPLILLDRRSGASLGDVRAAAAAAGKAHGGRL